MTKNNHTSVIFHLPFHPDDPPSYKIQQAWRDTIASPKYHMPLPNMCNPKTREKCKIECMIIAYHHPMNIGNLLSHCNLHGPACLIILSIWLETGGPVCVCVCLVCVCVCVCV